MTEDELLAELQGLVQQKKQRRNEYSKGYRARKDVKEREAAYQREYSQTINAHNGRARNKKKHLAIERLGGKCHDCNGVFVDDVYDFHHKDPSQKDFHIADLLHSTQEKLFAEVDKCVLLCANCHRTRHYHERTGVKYNNIPMEE